MRRKCNVCGVEWTCVDTCEEKCYICLRCWLKEGEENIEDFVKEYSIALLRCRDSLASAYGFKTSLLVKCK